MRFIVGMIVGLAVGWGLDFLSLWRRRDDGLAEKLQRLEAENRLLQTKLAAAERKLAQPQAEPEAMPDQTSPRKDRLERIKGIGAVFARRLNEAGIFSFDQLAALTSEQLKEIVQVEGWQRIEPEKWIAEAKALAGRD